MAEKNAPAAKTERWLSLDVFRGITLAGMIIVNNGGGKHVYTQLEHASWNGWTLADFVFPFFAFIIGVSIPFSFSNRLLSGADKKKLFLRILRRAVILFTLGILYNYNFDKPEWSHQRIMGVLQRLSLTYFFVSITALIVWDQRKRINAMVWLTIGLTGLYWALMKLVPVPGFGAGNLSPAGNLAAYIDNLLLRGHLYTPHWDPEGILHTLPAIATGMLGALTGHWVKSEKSMLEKIAGLFVAGNLLIALGLFLNHWFPINKNLWSPSYVYFSAGAAMSVLGACVWFVDYKVKRWWTLPFVSLGANALFAYLFSSLMAQMLTWPKIGAMELKPWLQMHVFHALAGEYNGALLYSLSYMALWMFITWLFYRKKIFIKV